MTKEKKIQYQKAYVELYEIIKSLPKEEQDKISNTVIKNLIENKDNDYNFELDKSKTLSEQNLMIETKALFVQIYGKYLSSENEKEIWKKYNKICANKIEEKKKVQYNPDNIFKKDESILKTEEIADKKDIKSYTQWAMVEYKKETILKRFINRIKRFFHKNEWDF